MKYQKHSKTSFDAAVAVLEASTSLRAQVYCFIRSRGSAGATDCEIQRALQMNPSTQRPRRVELVESGVIRDSGETRPTLSGRSAVVWVAVEYQQQKQLFAKHG